MIRILVIGGTRVLGDDFGLAGEFGSGKIKKL